MWHIHFEELEKWICRTHIYTFSFLMPNRFSIYFFRIFYLVYISLIYSLYCTHMANERTSVQVRANAALMWMKLACGWHCRSFSFTFLIPCSVEYTISKFYFFVFSDASCWWKNEKWSNRKWEEWKKKKKTRTLQVNNNQHTYTVHINNMAFTRTISFDGMAWHARKSHTYMSKTQFVTCFSWCERWLDVCVYV